MITAALSGSTVECRPTQSTAAHGLQERKSIEKQGYQAYRLNGTELTRKHWDQFYMFYRNTTGKLASCTHRDCVQSPSQSAAACCCLACYTCRDALPSLPCVLQTGCLRGSCLPPKQRPYPEPAVLPADKKWGQAYLNRRFFHLLGETMPERVVMAVAADGKPQGEVVAAALNLQGSHALFGRNWGCDNRLFIKHLHFELCYYQVRTSRLGSQQGNEAAAACVRPPYCWGMACCGAVAMLPWFGSNQLLPSNG